MAVEVNKIEVLQSKSDRLRDKDSFGKDGTGMLGQNRLDWSPYKEWINI